MVEPRNGKDVQICNCKSVILLNVYKISGELHLINNLKEEIWVEKYLKVEKSHFDIIILILL